MRLRRRLAVVFAATTSLTVTTAFAVAFGIFRHAQGRQLDFALFARAELEAEETMRLGGHHLHIEQEPSGSDTNLEHLVKYGAIYRSDGTLVETTPTFGNEAPDLSLLGWKVNSELPIHGFDFPYREHILRGVLVRVGHGPPALLLLLAAPRGQLDTDARHLLQVMGGVLVAAALLSLLTGRLVGVRMSRGIEGVASVARQITEGDLAARVAVDTVGSNNEVRSLAVNLNEMIHRIEELIATERRFASNAAHELRSPLTALRGELELALRRPRGVDEYRAAITESLESTERLVALAEDLLVLARAEVKQGERGQNAHSVREVISDAVRASLARAEVKRTIDVTVDADLVLRGRKTDLVRMVRNLVDNAVAHAPEGTTVRVTGTWAAGAGPTDSGARVAIAVEDDGPGVSAEIAQRVFDPFFRGDTERATAGVGLGLAIARELARAHGGDLSLDQARSRGARFSVVLPGWRSTNDHAGENEAC